MQRKIFEAILKLDTNNIKSGMPELNNNRYHSFNLRFNDWVQKSEQYTANYMNKIRKLKAANLRQRPQ